MKPHYHQLFRRYIWLLDTIFSAGHISKEEIDRRWAMNQSLNEEHESQIPERTFHRHRIAIEEMFGLIISYDRATNTYFIENREVLGARSSSPAASSFQQWLFNSFAVSNLLQEAQHLNKYICFEPIPSGQRYLVPLIEAIRDHQAVEITYQRFSVVDDGVKLQDNPPQTFLLQPYCLKCFHQRWYVVGQVSEPDQTESKLKVFALDRITSLIPTTESYTIPDNFDPEAFSLYCYGVSGMNDQPELIRVRVDEQQANYLRSLPLHPSQQEVEVGDGYSIFTFFLVANTEFRHALWEHNEHLEILAPAWLREETQYQIRNLYNKYWL